MLDQVTTDQIALLLSAVIGSVAVSTIGTLWKLWTRLRRLFLGWANLWFDEQERKLGLDNLDRQPTLKTAMDALLEDSENPDE